MGDRNLSFFASDVHMGLKVGDPKDREARFVSFLRSIPKDRTETLYLLGDIWDFWYEYHDVVPKGYVRVFAELLALMDAGVKVRFFKGNHDIWCYKYFRELGIEVLPQPYVVQIGEKKFCLAHGDGLGPGMWGYKLMAWAFNARFFQILFSFLHPWLSFRIGKSISRNNRLGRSEEYVFRGKDESLYKWAEEFSSKERIDCFVFGHYHVHEDLFLSTGSRFIILKDWMTTSPYLYFDGTSGMLGYCPNME